MLVVKKHNLCSSANREIYLEYKTARGIEEHNLCSSANRGTYANLRSSFETKEHIQTYVPRPKTEKHIRPYVPRPTKNIFELMFLGQLRNINYVHR
jgi:hypothetical protein